MFITGKHLPRRTMLKGMGVTLALAVPRCDGAGGQRRRAVARGRAKKVRLVAIEMVHGSAGSTAFGIKKNLWAPADDGRDFDLSPTSLKPLEPFRDHITIVSNTDVRNAEAFTLAGDRRRPLPLERGVPHPDAPEADAGLGRLRRHVARPDVRQPLRPGHADSVDAAVHRERRPGRRLLLRLLVHLHRLDQLGVADAAAADGARPARGVRHAVRRRRHARRAARAARRGQEPARLAVRVGRRS